MLPVAEGTTTAKQLQEMKLACSNMKCLVVIGEQNHSQRMCVVMFFCFLFGGLKMMSGTKTRYVCDHICEVQVLSDTITGAFPELC